MSLQPTLHSHPATATSVGCRHCPVGHDCLIRALPANEMQRLVGVLIPQLPLTDRGRSLYDAGTPADWIYLVRAGCIKTFTVDELGQERVRGFFFAGDVVGLESLDTSRYTSHAMAVSSAQICRIAKGQLPELLSRAPALSQHLIERTSAELRLALALTADYNADQRLAAFLLHLQERLGQHSHELRLPMGRRDIANYLRLATETVSRVLGRFEDRGWLRSDDRQLQLLDEPALWQLAADIGICRPRLRRAA